MKIVCHFCLKSASAVIEAPWGKGSADYVYHCPEHRDAAIGYIRSFSHPGRLVLKEKSLLPHDFKPLYLCWSNLCTCAKIDGETPLHEVDGIPSSVPQGTQWVLFTRYAHGATDGGGTYNYRFYALPFGTWDFDDGKITIGDIPEYCCTVDSNLEVTFPLPKGSWRWSKKSQMWHPATRIYYGY